MEWVDGNLGSKLTMKYPAIWLMEPGARGETLSIAFAGDGQHQDAGAKMVHCAPDTSSRIISKSISKNGGRASYRGLVRVQDGAVNCKSNVVCDALILDLEKSDGLGIRRSLRPQQLPEATRLYLAPRPRVAYFFEPVRDEE